MPKSYLVDLAKRSVMPTRRPPGFLWRPSKPLPWWLGYYTEGRRFTLEQDDALAAAGKDPETVEAMNVRREIDLFTERGMANWGELLPYYEFECPILRTLDDGRIEVMGPNGKPKKVRADGWAHKPTMQIYRDDWSMQR